MRDRNVELKDCPFCGGDKSITECVSEEWGDYWQVFCEACLSAAEGDTEQLAVKQWNTRAPSSDAADKARIAELEAALRHVVPFIERMPADCMGAHEPEHDGATGWFYRDEWLARAHTALAGSSASTAAKPAEVVT